MADPKNAPPPARGKRFFKLAGMTASVASRYAGNKLKNLLNSPEEAAKQRAATHAANGRRIARTLGELKGAAMKVGQMASIASDILPGEVATALRQLQADAPPMPFEVIDAQLQRELPAAARNRLKRFQHAPFASASIGQVHRATLDDGTEVVCKVQYPSIDGAVDSDLKHLRLTLKSSGIAHIGRDAFDAGFAELRERLHEELDYRHEAKNLSTFAAFHAQHPFIRIPRVIPELSAQRVLTLTYEPGTPLTEASENFPQQALDKVGENLVRMLLAQIFDLRTIHADPNPGNFACRTDGTIIIYDFGSTKALKPPIVQAYRDVIVEGLNENYAAVEDALLRLKLRNPNGPTVDHGFYKTWRDLFATPFIDQPYFDFGQSSIHREVLRQAPGLLKRMASFHPSRELLFLDRTVAGHYGNLRRLKARVPTLQLVERAIAVYDRTATIPDSSPASEPVMA